MGCFSIALQVLRAGHFWQIATYAFVHPPSIWFAINLYMLFFFGREVERFIGQRAFILLYVSLVLLPTLFLTIWGLSGRILYGDSSAVHFGIFVAFAAIYPNVELLFRIQVKWVALAFGVHLGPATSLRQRLAAALCLPHYRRLRPGFYSRARHRARAGMVDQSNREVSTEAKIPGRPALSSAPRDRARERLRFDRSAARENLALRP